MECTFSPDLLNKESLMQRTYCLALAALILSAMPAQPVSVTYTIDPSIRYQTIRGFGGMIYAGNTDDVPDLVNELGLSIVRFELSGLNTAETQITEDGLVDALQAAGVNTFIATPWSSPSQFEKANNAFDTTKSDGWLDWWIGRVKMFRTRHGVELFGASIQNEPTLGPVYYDVTNYTPLDFRHLVRKIGPRLVSEGLSTKVLWSEDVMGANWRGSLGAVATDTLAGGGGPYAPYFCIHGYDASGVTPSSANASTWLPVGLLTAQYDKEAWLTETSGVTGSTDWEHAINWAGFFYSLLKYARLSVYVHHYVALPELSSSHHYFLEGNTKYPWYYAVRSFWYFIKKGAVQIDAVSNNSTHAAPLAFAHPENRTLTLVFVNPTGETVQATLGGADLPQSYQRHVTASGQNCVSMGTVNAGSISLPPSSITTLVADNYDFSATAALTPRSALATRSTAGVAGFSGRLFTLDGREVENKSVRSASSARSGVYLSRGATATPRLELIAR
jgi:O-glycosyl hydrolase